jgi:hypothetical protein
MKTIGGYERQNESCDRGPNATNEQLKKATKQPSPETLPISW